MMLRKVRGLPLSGHSSLQNEIQGTCLKYHEWLSIKLATAFYIHLPFTMKRSKDFCPSITWLSSGDGKTHHIYTSCCLHLQFRGMMMDRCLHSAMETWWSPLVRNCLEIVKHSSTHTHPTILTGWRSVAKQSCSRPALVGIWFWNRHNHPRHSEMDSQACNQCWGNPSPSGLSRVVWSPRPNGQVSRCSTVYHELPRRIRDRVIVQSLLT